MQDDFALFDFFLPEEKAPESSHTPDLVQNGWSPCSFTRKPTTQEVNILADVQGLGLSDDVVMLSNRIYQETTGSKTIRGKSRLGIICTCVYYASNQLYPNAMSYDEAIRLFKIDNRVALKGFRIVNNANSGAITCFTATPETYIILFLKKFSAPEATIEDALAAFRQVQTSLSARPRPQSTASAFLNAWFKKKHSPVTTEQLSLITGVSRLTIEKIEKEIQWPSTP